jgi:hypothetical protein
MLLFLIEEVHAPALPAFLLIFFHVIDAGARLRRETAIRRIVLDLLSPTATVYIVQAIRLPANDPGHLRVFLLLKLKPGCP